MTGDLVLSLFPGLDGLGIGFEQEGFSVVAGPDLQWGRNVKTFHVPPDRFDGVIGGPPCQRFSELARLIRHVHGEDSLAEDLIPEFERIAREAQPAWFLMENVEGAPLPAVPGYVVRDVFCDPRWLGEVQQRRRRFSFGTHGGVRLDLSPELALFEAAEWQRAVLASESKAGDRPKPGPPGTHGPNRQPRRTLAEALRLQGLPADCLDEAPFTVAGKYRLIGNAVPVPMARAMARAVRRALSATRPPHCGRALEVLDAEREELLAQPWSAERRVRVAEIEQDVRRYGDHRCTGADCRWRAPAAASVRVRTA